MPVFEQLVADTLALGAAKAAVIDVDAIETDAVFRTMCASNACGMYGKCYMCPPDCGDIHDMMAHIRRYDYALVYQTVGRLEDSYDFEGMQEAGDIHNKIGMKLRRVVDAYPFAVSLHLGAGGCRVCPICAKRTGEPCRKPELAMSSLEAYGINVSKLASAAGMKYVNGQNTVTYFGAVLFSLNEEGKGIKA